MYTLVEVMESIDDSSFKIEVIEKDVKVRFPKYSVLEGELRNPDNCTVAKVKGTIELTDDGSLLALDLDSADMLGEGDEYSFYFS